MTRDQEIAATILKQLGGTNRLEAMIGARYFTAVKNGVTFNFRGSKNYTHCRILLDADDTYSVHLMNIRGTDIKAEIKLDMIYASNLREVIEEHTGLVLGGIR